MSGNNTVNQPSRSNQEYITVNGVRKRNLAYSGGSHQRGKGVGQESIRGDISGEFSHAEVGQRDGFYPVEWVDTDPVLREEEESEAIDRFLVEGEGEEILLNRVFDGSIPDDYHRVMGDPKSDRERESIMYAMLETPGIYENVYADEDGLHVSERGMDLAADDIRENVIGGYRKARERLASLGNNTKISAWSDDAVLNRGVLTPTTRQLSMKVDSASSWVANNGFIGRAEYGTFTRNGGGEHGVEINRGDGTSLRLIMDTTGGGHSYEVRGDDKKVEKTTEMINGYENDDYLDNSEKITEVLRNFLDLRNM